MTKSLHSKGIAFPKAVSWQVFDSISSRYDLLNHLLSFGLDFRWRKRLKDFLPSQDNQLLLDVACGTGDVLIVLVQENPRIAKAYGIDLAKKMLGYAQRKVERKGLQGKIQLRHGDAQEIPFPEKTFDTVTIAFGIRNIENPIFVLKEMYRVLKNKGKVLILEFSLPENFLLRTGHLIYLKTIVPLLGGMISGHFKAYRYLNQTIERFPYGEQFRRMMEQVGFHRVQAHPLAGGIACIYEGEKP